MKYIRRTVGFEIKIKSAIDNKATDRVSFSSDIDSGYNNNLLSYSYTESMQNIQGSFSLSAVYSDDLDKIEVHDIVEIKEGVTSQRKTAFIGLIKDIKHGKKMNNNGQVTNVINISGTNIFGIIAQTKFVVNRGIIGSLCKSDAVTNFQKDINSKIDTEKPLNEVLISIKNAFTKLKDENMQGSQYYTDIVNKIAVKAENLKPKYPMALGYLGFEQCTLWQLISKIVPSPIYECYLTINDSGYDLVIRESPFLSGNIIDLKELNKLYLTGTDVHKTDKEVYSYYLPLISGSGITQNIIQVLMNGSGDAGENADQNNNDKQITGIVNIDNAAMARFGYRPLIVELGFFDNTQAINDEMLKNIASSLLNANKDNHKKLSGIIETLHDGSVWHVGTVIKSENKEYYIEQIDTSWSYGQAHTRRFYVTRGGSKVNTAS